jgi:hypothetical protein
MDTPRRLETGRPRTAQFAPWAVYIEQGKNAARCGRKKVTLVRPMRSDLIARARAGAGEAFAEVTEPYRRVAVQDRHQPVPQRAALGETKQADVPLRSPASSVLFRRDDLTARLPDLTLACRPQVTALIFRKMENAQCLGCASANPGWTQPVRTIFSDGLASVS